MVIVLSSRATTSVECYSYYHYTSYPTDVGLSGKCWGAANGENVAPGSTEHFVISGNRWTEGML